MFEQSKEKMKLGEYVKGHKKELDEIMVKIFDQWNAVGKLSINTDESNKMQVTYLITLIKIMLNASGMPKSVQRGTLEQLLKNL